MKKLNISALKSLAIAKAMPSLPSTSWFYHLNVHRTFTRVGSFIHTLICRIFSGQTKRTNQNVIDIVYNLHSKGNLWLAERDGKRITASSLEELDSLISEHIRIEFKDHKGEDLDIRMYFDQSEIPEWMRQYANHYFNRHIRITI